MPMTLVWIFFACLLIIQCAWSQSVSFSTTTLTNMRLELSCRLLPSRAGADTTPIASVSLRNTSAAKTNELIFFENPLQNFFVYVLDSKNEFITKLPPTVHSRKPNLPTYIAIPPLGQKTWEVPINDVMPNELKGGSVTNCSIYIHLRCDRGNEQVRASVHALGVTTTQNGSKAYQFIPDSFKR